MIKDWIIYKNKILLTIYHQGFLNEKDTIKRCIKEHIGRNLLCFKEEYVVDDEWNCITGYAWEESALVTPKEEYNPYYECACANMIHRVFLEKPTVIWKADKVIIDEQELERILVFVKKYTGMDLQKCPIYLGDIFLFSPSRFQYHTNKQNSIILYDIKKGMKIILHFKYNNNIVQSKIIDIEEDKRELEITTESNWNNHDIEIYKDNKLVYLNQDISYMRSMQLNMSIMGQKERLPLTTLKEYYEFEIEGSTQTTFIGERPEEIEQTLNEMNQDLTRKIKNHKATERFLLVRPGEIEVAMKKITKMMYKAKDKLWIIDSYFTDKGSGLGQMIDWVRLIANTKATEKNIIFYCNNEDKALDVIKLKEYMLKDVVIRDKLKETPIDLFQTKTAIHDRFLIICNNDVYSGLAIGTSFNSLNSNHYCIQELTHSEAKEVITTLTKWIEKNLVIKDRCINDKE